MANTDVKETVDKLVESAKELPRLVKENKGAVIGVAVAYLLGEKIAEKEGLLTAIVGGLVGHAVDEKTKETKVAVGVKE